MDFIIIGAQKSGTTSLAHYLNESEDIFIPKEKEVPFFLDLKMQEKGFNWFFREYFNHSKKGQLIGVSTPQYASHPEVFFEIYNNFPKSKLIFIVRDPIDRLVSHYNMAKRSGVESRDINDVIDDQFENLSLYRESNFYNKNIKKYIASGEYERVINKVLQHFPRKQFLVLDFKRLIDEKYKQDTLNKVCNFLDISNFTISNPNYIGMKGGGNIFNHHIIFKNIKKLVELTNTKSLIPGLLKKQYRLLNSFLDSQNVRGGGKTSKNNINKKNLTRLNKHFVSNYKDLCDKI
jgi:hypothetical protein